MNALPSVLNVEHVSKSFGGLIVLNDISLSLKRGELVGLIGPNGAGKSTLFNIITSIYRPDRGEVFLDGERITGRAPYKLCRMGIARTFQLIRTFPDMSVLENVMIGAVYGQRDDTVKRLDRALEALELVGLSGKRDTTAEHINLSERRLLEVARAFACRPRVMLLDEPIAGLNATDCLTVQGVIQKMREMMSVSVLWVEHKVDAIFRVCERVIVIDHGLKIADGEPKRIANDPRVIEAYLGKDDA